VAIAAGYNTTRQTLQFSTVCPADSGRKNWNKYVVLGFHGNYVVRRVTIFASNIKM